ncbi:MAG: hypothetical protein U1E22_10790, partial [Coriobacteriia bacterium]|nr:hypothetical protein [Coriobacteriia bacterium]
VSVLLIVSDPSIRGVRTAQRLSELADELSIGVGSRYLIINRGQTPLDPALHTAAEAAGLEFLGVIPHDEGITRADLDGGSVFDLASDSPALAAVRDTVTSVVPALRNAKTQPAQTPTRRQM